MRDDASFTKVAPFDRGKNAERVRDMHNVKKLAA